MINFFKSLFSKKEILKHIEFSKVDKYLEQNQIVWCWCEYTAGKEWRKCVYNEGYFYIMLTDYYLKFTRSSLSYSLNPYSRVIQNVKYFTLSNKKPKYSL